MTIPANSDSLSVSRLDVDVAPELLPSPFCGREAVIDPPDANSTLWLVTCSAHNGTGDCTEPCPCATGTTLQEAAARWNRRSVPASAPKAGGETPTEIETRLREIEHEYSEGGRYGDDDVAWLIAHLRSLRDEADRLKSEKASWRRIAGAEQDARVSAENEAEALRASLLERQRDGDADEVERESCAQVCESREKSLRESKQHGEANEAHKCAMAIRARLAGSPFQPVRVSTMSVARSSTPVAAPAASTGMRPCDAHRLSKVADAAKEE